ncbi:hypothetical protein C8Q78DRAFT_1005799 [Trametes maxima]|nr:hypothetical protein C8Q78DRAFT_1005799 [Trametes maxima]
MCTFGSIGICGSFLRYAWATHLRCTGLWKHNPCHAFCVPDWLKTLQSMAHTIVQMSVLSLPIRCCKLQRLQRCELPQAWPQSHLSPREIGVATASSRSIYVH